MRAEPDVILQVVHPTHIQKSNRRSINSLPPSLCAAQGRLSVAQDDNVMAAGSFNFSPRRRFYSWNQLFFLAAGQAAVAAGAAEEVGAPPEDCAACTLTLMVA
jgi:hypothetical protein